MELPAVVIGFDNQGYGLWDDDLDALRAQEQGLLLCGHPQLVRPPGHGRGDQRRHQLQLSEDTDESGLDFFAGLEQDFDGRFALVVDYAAGLNDRQHEEPARRYGAARAGWTWDCAGTSRTRSIQARVELHVRPGRAGARERLDRPAQGRRQGVDQGDGPADVDRAAAAHRRRAASRAPAPARRARRRAPGRPRDRPGPRRQRETTPCAARPGPCPRRAAPRANGSDSLPTSGCSTVAAPDARAASSTRAAVGRATRAVRPKSRPSTSPTAGGPGRHPRGAEPAREVRHAQAAEGAVVGDGHFLAERRASCP